MMEEAAGSGEPAEGAEAEKRPAETQAQEQPEGGLLDCCGI